MALPIPGSAKRRPAANITGTTHSASTDVDTGPALRRTTRGRPRTSKHANAHGSSTGRHGIRRQPDITFKEFANIYLRDHADLHKKSAKRDREILKTLNRFFGSAILHEISSAPHRAIQARSAQRNLARVQAKVICQPSQARNGESRAGYAQVDSLEGGRMEVPRRFASQGSETVQTAEQADADSLTRGAAPPPGRVRKNAEAPGAAQARADHSR